MGTGWNFNGRKQARGHIITDWDMGTGWNSAVRTSLAYLYYNRLGYGYWLEHNQEP